MFGLFKNKSFFQSLLKIGKKRIARPSKFDFLRQDSRYLVLHTAGLALSFNGKKLQSLGIPLQHADIALHFFIEKFGQHKLRALSKFTLKCDSHLLGFVYTFHGFATGSYEIHPSFMMKRNSNSFRSIVKDKLMLETLSSGSRCGRNELNIAINELL